MSKMALIVIDVQECLINDDTYEKDEFIQRLKVLLHTARKEQVPVLYVRHNETEGEMMTGTFGHQIYHEVMPEETECIVDKWYNSIFKNTGLREHLKEAGVEDLMLVGMQTEFCFDASVKAGFEHGFQIFVPEMAHTTFDSETLKAEEIYNHYTYEIWNNRYAKVVSLEDAIRLLGE